MTEKVDKFYDKHAPLEAIIFDYYLNFIPFFFNMLSPLFVFIAVIFFTSKLAGNSEIIAIQSSGVSYNRILRPYLITATLIAITIFLLGSFVIPKSNKTRLEFENEYVKPFKKESVMNIQLEVDKGVILYIGHFESSRNTGYRVSMEKFNGKTLASRLTAQEIKYDTLTGRWQMNNFVMREFDGIHEKLQTGFNLDTAINIVPADFFVNIKEAPQMTTKELSEYIDRQRSRGVGAIKAFEDEYYRTGGES